MLEQHEKTQLSRSAATSYLHRLGYSYDLRKASVYVDGFDRPDVVDFRMNIYLPRQVRAESR